MGKRSIEELVKAISITQDGQRSAMQELEDAAREAGVSLRFFLDPDSDHFYDVDSSGPYFHGEEYDGDADYPITPEEYLDVLREHLVARLQESEQSEADLKELIRRFTKKQAGHRDLKDAADRSD